jgi:putative colanic acid biosynthesis acetyltransferase WcaF
MPTPDDTSVIPATGSPDPFLVANTDLSDRLARGLWRVAYVLLFRFSPRPLHAWRALVLRMFGARLGPKCRIYPKVRIWAPWNLECEDVVAIADEAVIYNPQTVRLGSHSIVSEQAYLCGATHDYTDPSFRMISAPIVVGPYAWICARAAVQMGVTIGEGAILGLGSIATADLDAWTVYVGAPARKVKSRPRIPLTLPSPTRGEGNCSCNPVSRDGRENCNPLSLDRKANYNPLSLDGRGRG